MRRFLLRGLDRVLTDAESFIAVMRTDILSAAADHNVDVVRMVVGWTELTVDRCTGVAVSSPKKRGPFALLCLLVAATIVAYPVVATESRKFDVVFLIIVAILATFWMFFVARRVAAYVERQDDLSHCVHHSNKQDQPHRVGITFILMFMVLYASVALSIAYIIMRNVTRWGIILPKMIAFCSARK